MDKSLFVKFTYTTENGTQEDKFNFTSIVNDREKIDKNIKEGIEICKSKGANIVFVEEIFSYAIK